MKAEDMSHQECELFLECILDVTRMMLEAGNEAQRSIDLNSKPDYRQKLEEELRELRESEMWQAGAVVRKLRPENN